MKDLLFKIKRKFTKLRLQPIRVFCLHHVCKAFDGDSMHECDWMDIEAFKRAIIHMHNNGAKFISMSEAYQHITNDNIRRQKYIALTFDDGYASLKERLPWLEKQQIPVTLFINGKYLDGKSYRKNAMEKYMTKDELWSLTSPLIEVANHGWEHIRVTEMSEDEFRTSVEQNEQLLSTHPNYIPFWAYTYGTHTDFTDSYLLEKHIIPVYIDGVKNYNGKKVIHRELLI